MSNQSLALEAGLAGSEQTSRSAHAGAGSRRFAVIVLLVAVTFGQRFCFPLSTFQISLVVPAAYLALYLAIFSGAARINTLGFVLYAAAIAAMIATLYVGKTTFSPFSIFYLIVLYLVYVVSIEVEREEYLGYLRIFQWILVVLAGIALAQYAEQRLIGSTLSLIDYLPDGFVLSGYNTRPTLAYGSTFHKANAEFFLEPSFLSQYMALGIIIEIVYFGRWWRAALYLLAIYVSFSGTGMVLLGIFALLAAVKARRYEVLYALPVLLVAYLAFHDSPFVTTITGRVDEFESDQSSAYIRFIGPNQALEDLIYPDFLAFLVGRGPGVVDALGRNLGYVANFPVMHKLLIEYGIVGLLPFMGFILWRLFAAARSKLLAAALLVMYLFLSGSLLQPHTIYLAYVLTIMMPKAREEA